MCNSGENSWKVPEIDGQTSEKSLVSRCQLQLKGNEFRSFTPPKLPPFSAHFAADRGRGQLSTALESEEHLGEIVCQQLALSVVSFSFFGPPLM